MLVALVAGHGVTEERFPPATFAWHVLVSIMVGVVIINVVLVIGVGREEGVHQRQEWERIVSPRDCTARGQAGQRLVVVKRVLSSGAEAGARGQLTAHGWQSTE